MLLYNSRDRSKLVANDTESVNMSYPEQLKANESANSADLHLAQLPSPVGHLGRYRVVNLSRIVDPATESRRCKLRRHMANVQGVEGFHTDMDISTHLGTHLEAPCHHPGLSKEMMDISPDHFLARGVLMKLDTCDPGALITRADLEAADRSRIRNGDVLVLDSRFHAEPFAQDPNDQRPNLSRESAEWFLEKEVKAIGFGDGIAIENDAEHCIACHDIMLGNDILFIEAMKNLDQLEQDVFLLVYTPLPIRGLDSSPVNVMAIEGIPGFTLHD